MKKLLLIFSLFSLSFAKVVFKVDVPRPLKKEIKTLDKIYLEANGSEKDLAEFIKKYAIVRPQVAKLLVKYYLKKDKNYPKDKDYIVVSSDKDLYMAYVQAATKVFQAYKMLKEKADIKETLEIDNITKDALSGKLILSSRYMKKDFVSKIKIPYKSINGTYFVDLLAR